MIGSRSVSHGISNRGSILFSSSSNDCIAVDWRSKHTGHDAFWSTTCQTIEIKGVGEALICDLDERYAALEQSAGRRAATRWFWREVAHSFLSLLFDALKRISGLDKLYRRIGS
jgi:hypothetical protein